MSATGHGPASTGGLTVGERVSIFMRSFLIQSVWNTRGMQNVGFCFSVLPVLRRVHGEGAARAFLRRHLAFFNTNPALSTYALSAAAAAEVAGDPEGAVEMKRALSSPLGMAGDALLWGAVRPAAGLLAVSAALAGVTWAPLLLILFYNAAHLPVRVRGIQVGAALGPRGAKEVSGPAFRRVVSGVRYLACFAAGLAVALALGAEGSVAPQGFVVAGAFFLLTLVALRARVPIAAIGVAGVLGGVAIMLSRV